HSLILRPGIYLPVEICDKLISRLTADGNTTDVFLNLFSNTTATRLHQVDLHGCENIVTGIQSICRHDIVELDISGCIKIESSALQYLQLLCPTLRSLNVNGCHSLMYGATAENFAFVNLRLLDIGNTSLHPQQLQQIIPPLISLTSLDLSRVVKDGDLTFLHNLKFTLRSLVLFDCMLRLDSSESFLFLHNMTALRHLDISQERGEIQIMMSSPNVLDDLLDKLPNLVSLDVSGTDLYHHHHHVSSAGGGKVVKMANNLRHRQKRLEFLGLLDTEACEEIDLPAVKVAGDGNEEQILNALEVYANRDSFLMKALNSLFDIVRAVDLQRPSVAVQRIIAGMTRHTQDIGVQISGSASLYHLTKRDSCVKIGCKLRRQAIIALITAMEESPADSTLQRNACLTLCNFKVPEELEFMYERVARLLLELLVSETNDEFIQKVAVYLCNAIVCQVDGAQKQLVGRIGVVKTMLTLIQERLVQRNCDEVMEIAWSTLWNVTDETAENCQMFLAGGGMTLFLACLSAFPDKVELLRNMMGLLGNVSEVQELRGELIQYVQVFSTLLANRRDGIEVSYNAAGVIAHIASDGIDQWSPEPAERKQVLSKMVHAIESWDLKTQRNINYRSFEPILRLLSCYHTPQVQHWAAWALANLTSVYPEKYCPLLSREGGCELLLGIVESDHPAVYSRIRELAEKSLSNVRYHLENH
ncbi:protein zer-1 homolog, partial [Glandiceps talaboti]